MFQRAGIQNLHAGRSRIKVHVVAAVMHHGFAGPIVHPELTRHSAQLLTRQRLGNMRHLAVDRRARLRQQIARFRRLHLHAGIHQQFKRLAQNAIDQFRLKQLQFRPHKHSPRINHGAHGETIEKPFEIPMLSVSADVHGRVGRRALGLFLFDRRNDP